MPAVPPPPGGDLSALLRAAQEDVPSVQGELSRGDVTLVGQLRRLTAQLQQAADQLERLGAVLHVAEFGAGAAPLDEQQLMNMLLASQRGTTAVPPAARYSRYAEVADELERLAGMLRTADGGAAPGPIDDQQLLGLLMAARHGPRGAPELQRYAKLLDLLSSLGHR